MGRLLEFVAVSFFHFHPYIDFDFDNNIDRMLQPFSFSNATKSKSDWLEKEIFEMEMIYDA